MTADELQSKVFDFLRFPLIVGVVFSHTYNFMGGGERQIKEYQCFSVVRELFSQILPKVAVPFFFLTAGYFFFKTKEFNKEIYLRKIKSRFRSLFIPYIIWNLLAILLMYIVSIIPYTTSFFSNTPSINLNYILSSLLGSKSANGIYYPIAAQFWFIRDLIVLVVLSPVLYWLIRKSRNIIVILLGLCLLFGFSVPSLGERCLSTRGLFYFSLGACLSINEKNVIEIVSKFRGWVFFLYFALVVGDLCTSNNGFGNCIHQVGIFCGLICWLKFATYLIEVKGINQAPILAASSFFIFAIHQPFLLTPIENLVERFFNPSSDISLLFLYFGIVIVVVLLGLGISCLLRKFMPKFTAVLTGGRVKRM